ncbi:MAG: deoxyhypusine synthase [Deltaproteobacteria bacterium]|nr:MAG: deoxyhypusine synthase [Deltaproteobacteria bacterium]
MGEMRQFLRGKRIDPHPITSRTTVPELIDGAFLAYNGARLREAAQLFSERMLAEDVTIGISLSGALTPAGLGMSCIIPLIEAGFVDWIVSTGANLYHDTHSDAFYRKILFAPEFQREMGTAEFHYLIGAVIAERQRALGLSGRSLLVTAHEHGVPVYTSSPGDSSIGMNVAALAIEGCALKIDVSRDVNETAAIVLGAKRDGGKSAVLILGGGSPKNFLLQTEPQVQEVLGIEEKGHDYYVQFTDARVDTGGLSGATPSEAVSWGKVDPEKLPDTVVCYCDSTIALPLITAYALATHAPRKPKRLYERRDALMERLVGEYRKAHVYGPDGGFKPRR